MYFAENIKLLRKRKGQSQDQIAAALDIKRSTWSGYENGIEPNYSTLLKITDYFKMSLDNLLKQDLNSIPESQLSQVEKGREIDIEGNRLRLLVRTIDLDNNENIELVPLKAKAGYTTGYADPDYIKVLQAFNLPFLDCNKKYRTFQISGDSMPPVPDGSWVTAEFILNWLHIKNGHPYIVLTKDEGIVFKMVYNKIEEKGALLLCSTNPAYEPYEVLVDEVMEVWKFTNYISSEIA